MQSRTLSLLAVCMLLVIAGLGILLGQDIKRASTATPADKLRPDYLRAVYSPLHFKPAAENASDAQCLACHQEVLTDVPRQTSPAGISAASSKAWYQQLSTYQGAQDTFHRRHLLSPLAKELMNLQCNTCHQGHNPRDEAPGTSADRVQQSDRDTTLRKQVNTETVCLKCHGQMPLQNMGLPSPWPQSKALFANNCLTCHASIRTQRHQVTYLKAAAIEAAGQANSDSCYGCHGGRAWYRIGYPYPRHPWAGMPAEVPEWAKGRPTESEARFLLTRP